MKISEFLGKGESEARTMTYLKSIIPGSSREIRKLIEIERRAGTPILSNCTSGYFLAQNRGEIERFCQSMRARAFEINRTAALVQLSEINFPEGTDGD